MIKSTVLVTEAAGNTGAPTVAHLLKQGYPVRVLVRHQISATIGCDVWSLTW
jgi:uncharacterized protein YbjT (DUF2867 family)